MRKAALISLFLLAAAVALLILERPTTSNRPSDAATADTAMAEERLRTLRFWELYREATDHRTAGRIQEAVSAYERALELDDSHEDVLYYLGSLRLELGQFQAAEQAWRRLVEVNPSSARTHSQLGALYSCLDTTGLFDLDRARTEYQRALEINREQTGSLLGLGRVALLGGDLAAASRYYDQVIGSNPGSVEAHFLRGYIAWKRGQGELAAESFARAVRHARPQTSEVAGEGDTRAGAGPMLADLSRCRDIPAQVGALRRVREPTRGVAQAHYGELDALFRSVADRTGTGP